MAWLQRDFNGHEQVRHSCAVLYILRLSASFTPQLFACDARSFQHSATPQECLLTQLEGGVALMELVPDVEDCCENDALRGRCAVVSAVDGGDALYVLHVPSGSSSRNMLPPGHRVRAIVSSPTRPEHLLLIMRSAIAPSHCDDVYRLDLATGQLSLDTRNPGFVVQWLADLSTLSVRACVCAHSPQTPDVSALYDTPLPQFIMVTLRPVTSRRAVAAVARGCTCASCHLVATSPVLLMLEIVWLS